jgi:hypothetical protein
MLNPTECRIEGAAGKDEGIRGLYAMSTAMKDVGAHFATLWNTAADAAELAATSVGLAYDADTSVARKALEVVTDLAICHCHAIKQPGRVLGS